MHIERLKEQPSSEECQEGIGGQKSELSGPPQVTTWQIKDDEKQRNVDQGLKSIFHTKSGVTYSLTYESNQMTARLN